MIFAAKLMLGLIAVFFSAVAGWATAEKEHSLESFLVAALAIMILAVSL